MDLELERAGAEVQVSARGSGGERIAPRPLGREPVAFAEAVRKAAARGKPLDPAIREQAQALHRAVLGDGIDALRATLREAAPGAPLLLRLRLHQRDLEAVPWEAMEAPGEALGFWASSPDVLPVRAVATGEPWQTREVRGALRVLAVAPAGDGAALRDALAAPIAAGEIEWLDPVEGAAARRAFLLERLRREPIPHVLHFIGHGAVKEVGPVLRLADELGDEQWLPVELLGQQLKAGSRGTLRLVVLECCEGAAPSVFASAAEILARAGAAAVVAHLWPVRAEVARVCSEQLYRALAGMAQGRGDVALALNEARRALLASFDGSAEAFSPVLYLRGESPALFDFKGRKVVAPAPAAATSGGDAVVPPLLARLLQGAFSLLLGDHSHEERAAKDALRGRLDKQLGADPAPAGVPFSAVAQRFAFRKGADALGRHSQRAFPSGAEIPPLLAALARLAPPGVHLTLLRSPIFEQALAAERPDVTLYVLQPGERSVAVLRREAGGGDWEELPGLPSLDLDREIAVLRLYGGYTPDGVFTPPLLTEDDHLFNVPDLEVVLKELPEALAALRHRPALLLGLSPLAWDHRVTLKSVFGGRPLPAGSLAVLDPGSPETEDWEKVPGGRGISVVEIAAGPLCASLGGQGR
jgi:hypothetical protein